MAIPGFTLVFCETDENILSAANIKPLCALAL
jgi:hypothetical protein